MSSVACSIQIKKGRVVRGRFVEQVLRSGRTLRVLENYAKEHRALVGQHGALLLVKFADGAVCQTMLASEADAAAWIEKQCVAGGQFVKAAGVAHFKVVVFDETRYWTEDAVSKAGGKIYATYLYDSNCHTYCCELTPSYYLIHLFSTPLEDDEDGSAAEMIRAAQAGDDQNGYYHCRSIDSLPAELFVHDFGLDLVDDNEELGESRDELEAQYREWCQGNCGGLEFPKPAPAKQAA